MKALIVALVSLIFSVASLILAIVAMSGCATEADYLSSLPVVYREYNAKAVRLTAEFYGIDQHYPEVFWVVQGDYIRTEDGHPALGVSVGCASWVWWPPRVGEEPRTSTTFGLTAFAHELAHCAYSVWHGGDQDPGHLDAEWWGADYNFTLVEGKGSLVDYARQALIEAGL